MYMCVCVSFSGLPEVRKPMEDAAFPESFNYKATFPFSASELARTSITEKRADKSLESHLTKTPAQNQAEFCSENLFLAVEPRCVRMTCFQLVACFCCLPPDANSNLDSSLGISHKSTVSSRS